MKNFNTDSWLALGLLLILIVITFFVAVGQADEADLPALTSFSSAPNGAAALRLWLDEIGYPVERNTGAVFVIPEEAALVLLLEPLPGITNPEWEALDEWVEAGGTLVLAGENFGTLAAARHYDFRLAYLSQETTQLTAQTPLLQSPALTGAATARANAFFQTERTDFITHLAVDDGPILLSFEQGLGQVILSSTAYPFSNAGLKEAGNPALVLNLISAADQEQLVWFDEWHHNFRGAIPGDADARLGPGNWLRYTPTGRAFLYGAVVIFAAIVLSGRRFGRPIPPPDTSSRRAPLEYITAIANLSRRAGHRQATLLQYHHRLKRGLGQRYRLSPALPDEQYVTEIAQLNPNLDSVALRTLLAQLRRSDVSESQMITLAAEVAKWLKNV